MSTNALKDQLLQNWYFIEVLAFFLAIAVLAIFSNKKNGILFLIGYIVGVVITNFYPDVKILNFFDISSDAGAVLALLDLVKDVVVVLFLGIFASMLIAKPGKVGLMLLGVILSYRVETVSFDATQAQPSGNIVKILQLLIPIICIGISYLIGGNSSSDDDEDDDE